MSVATAIDPLTVGQVIVDVVNMFVPTITISVYFETDDITDTNGCEIKPSMAINHPKPRVEIGGNDLRKLYTLVMVDPDAPNPCDPTMREYLHWLVVDIPEGTDATFGQEITSYEGPSPTIVGIHRYVFVLFRQSGRQTTGAPGWRQNFCTRDFAEIYNLGLPVAATYFNGQREGGWGGRRW
ncbi:PREDICTED: protein HEADING DATE 3A-like [Nelumbo nucifera]|uniref:Protein HEADING DATE 3A-like n=1 Tax=Nelumbo nucifera TaxID=4432 RepID=A0A1U8AY77_NELNU|nr:PREDICTED: protein HEADING DATE 3A-like [Nelumbo nucifera]